MVDKNLLYIGTKARRVLACTILILATGALGGIDGTGGDENMQADLVALDAIPRRTVQEVAAFQKRVDSLAAKYAIRAESGAIYAHAGDLYAAMGPDFRGQEVESCKAAIMSGVHGHIQAHVYVLWGDALYAIAPTANAQERATIYLKGLSAIGYSLPEKPVTVPLVEAYDVVGCADCEAAAEKAYKASLRAAEAATETNALIQQRDTLAGRIIGLVAGQPNAPWFRNLAVQELGDQSAVDQLMHAIDLARREK